MSTFKRVFTTLVIAAVVVITGTAHASEQLRDAYKKYTREGKVVAVKTDEERLQKPACHNCVNVAPSGANGMGYNGTNFGGFTVGGMRVGNVMVGGLNVGGLNAAHMMPGIGPLMLK